jgi:hypothetical protein
MFILQFEKIDRPEHFGAMCGNIGTCPLSWFLLSKLDWHICVWVMGMVGELLTILLDCQLVDRPCHHQYVL